MSSRQASSSPYRLPPLQRNESSSPSLFGMDRSIPNFQDFVRRLPSADSSKPLPPVPLAPRRVSSGWPARSRSPSAYGNRRGRRASSVYSRTASMWQDDTISFSSADFADEPMPPLPTLQPLAYSLSTPQLGQVLQRNDSHEPRTYSPLIGTPSPATSRGRTPSPSRHVSGSVPHGSPESAGKKVRTVSLEQARRNMEAPGAVHLLPEELRARAIKRRRSDKLLRMDSVDIFSPINPPQTPDPPTLIDHQGRRRSIAAAFQNSSRLTKTPGVEVATGKLPYQTSFKVGFGPERHMDFHGVCEPEERGRARERTDCASRLHKRRSEGKRGMGSINANSAPIQYRSLVPDHPAARSPSSGYHDTDSDDSIKNRMKLIPHPLFRTKPPAKLPGAIIGHSHGHRDLRGRRYSGRSSKSSRGSFPFGFSRSPSSLHRRRSTSGSIPISPPTGISAHWQGTPNERHSGSPFRYGSDGSRDSAYYPSVTSKKTKMIHPDMTFPPNVPPSPPADITSIYLNGSGSRSNGSSSFNRTESLGDKSRVSDKAGKRQLFSRAARTAAKYVDLFTKPPAHSPTQQQPSHPYPEPSSPHLLPSPVSPRSQHLGWSSKTKSAFDEARVSLQSPQLMSPPRTPSGPIYEHIAAPARPLDETKIGLRENESPPRGMTSMLGGMLDGWMEGRAEKRREELKKIISVVPGSTTHNGGAGGVEGRSSPFGWV